MLAACAGLAELATQLRRLPRPLTGDWNRVWAVFGAWAARPGLVAALRTGLRDLPPEQAADLAGRSRETTTHYAWCLVDLPGDPFSFWLNEYKPQREWRAGYADSVHNHRYHFCTTILTGCYLHEYFQVVLDPGGSRITGVVPAGRDLRVAGDSGSLLADEFHRIPEAGEGTITFLVKSRPVREWSLSFDPARGTSQRHVPVESRFQDLVARL